MRVLHYASRAVAAVALLVLAGGCGDSTAPDAPFDPAGTSADVAAIGESFESPALESYASAATQIGSALGGSFATAVRAMPTAAVADKAGALRYAASLARGYAPAGERPSLSAASIPPEYLGTTFVWDVDTDTYVASDLSGAPSNGVRFLLYAVNPATQQPIEPVVEVGYVDLTVSQTNTSITAHAIVVSGGVTYLDYAVVATAGTSSASFSVSGYVTNGTDRVNFDLEMRGTQDEATLDFQLAVPTRGGFVMEIEVTGSDLESDAGTFSLDMTARGDHGTVRIQGTGSGTEASYNVTVNGDLFATITETSTTLTILGPDGAALSPDERDALEAIWAMFGTGVLVFFQLLSPIFLTL